MLVFIDESGDPGFKIKKGSSQRFVVALIVFEDPLDAEETGLTIKLLRKKLGKRRHFEFKFNKCNKILRKKFLEGVKGCKFKVYATVFDKESIYNTHLRESKESFYNFALRITIEKNGKFLKKARIKLDGRGDRSFRRAFTAYLRKHLNTRNRKIVGKFRFADSKKNGLIQLADMVAGSLNRYYTEGAKQDKDYWDILKDKGVNIYEFK